MVSPCHSREAEADLNHSNDLLKWWKIEQGSPRWFKDANSLWCEDEQGFIQFCASCYRIYDLGNIIIYVQKDRELANVHIGATRSAAIDLTQLVVIRNELLQEFAGIYGWLVKQNRGMKCIAEQIGMKHYGVKMLLGESHGKVLEWECFSVNKSASNSG